MIITFSIKTEEKVAFISITLHEIVVKPGKQRNGY